MNEFFETSNFYLDGSPKQLDFVSIEKPSPIDWPNFNPEIEWSDDVEVEFIRGCMFFCSEQKTDKDGKKITLGKLREFFTSKAIKLLEKDGFIKLIIDHGEPG